jgi:CheY-like chemotaxis protein
VLLVEDHADTATVITLLLKKFGHTVDCAATVAEGMEKFAAGNYDVVLSDLGLPDGTGIDFVQKLRAQSQVPAVALTGYGMEDDIRRCTEAGFNAHLTKPVNFAELNAVIGRLTAVSA